jgi:transposase
VRTQYPEGSPDFGRADRSLHEAVERMKHTLEEQRSQPRLHQAQRDVLASLSNRWKGLTVFLDHPFVPMDNNGSERKLRTPVV